VYPLLAIFCWEILLAIHIEVHATGWAALGTIHSPTTELHNGLTARVNCPCRSPTCRAIVEHLHCIVGPLWSRSEWSTIEHASTCLHVRAHVTCNGWLAIKHVQVMLL